jgi:O-antigen/teichoic acid export membrane protein
MSNGTSTNTGQTGVHYVIGGLILIFLIFPFAASPVPGRPDLLPIAMLSVLIPIAGCVSLVRGLLRLQVEGRMHVPEVPQVSAGVALLPVGVGAIVGLMVIHQAGLLTDVAKLFCTFFACTGLGLCVALYLVGVRIIGRS